LIPKKKIKNWKKKKILKGTGSARTHNPRIFNLLHRIQEQLSIHLIQHRIPKGIYLDYNGTEIIRDTIESDEFILEQNIYVPKKENIIDEKNRETFTMVF